MGAGFFKDYDIMSWDSQELLRLLRRDMDTTAKVQLLYIGEGREYITENISLDWLCLVDAHTFFTGVEFKKAQKQRYNIQKFRVVLRIHADAH